MEPLKIKANALSDLKKEDTWGKFIGDMFYCRDLIHLAHLKTTSFAAHKALNEAYDELLDLTDDIAETLQGYKGILSITIDQVKYTDILPYLKEERLEYIQKQKECSDMPDIQNKLQEAIGLFSKTIYKLENLK